MSFNNNTNSVVEKTKYHQAMNSTATKNRKYVNNRKIKREEKFHFFILNFLSYVLYII